MSMMETVDRYIGCHKLSSASACDECEFDTSETERAALEKLHEYAMENPL